MLACFYLVERHQGRSHQCALGPPSVFQVRPSAFPAEAAVAGTPATATSAPVEAVSLEELAACSEQDWGVQWVGQDVTKSERPELASAK